MAIDSLIIFLIAGALVFKIFRIEYLLNWGSIESTFISDARMLAGQLPHPGWQPLWYCGTRFDFVYPPALRYGPALIAKVLGVSTARAYHLYTGLLYVLGIVAVYWLVLAGSRKRLAAWLSALGTALFSPAFLLLTVFRNDSSYWVPQRLHVLMSYGEGPHISSLSVLGAALAASWMAFRSPRLVWVALAGLASALVVTNNFYGATSLAIFFPLAAWAVWLGSGDWRVFAKAAAIAALAWGFCAFWLTPSYLTITVQNLKWVSDPGKASSRVEALLFVVLLAAVTWWLGNRRPDRAWAIFVYSAAAALTLYVAGFYYFGFLVTGVSGRLVPEMDLALILAGVQLGLWCWKRKNLRFAAVVLALIPLYPIWIYLHHLRSPFPVAKNVDKQYEFQVTDWIHRNLPGQRVLPAGSLRFWYDAWFDIAQTDGGSMQGMENQNLPDATWQIIHGDDAELATLWLQSLGTDAVAVGDASSLDQYHDYAHPEKFRGVLQPLMNDGHGTVIYRIPRRYPGIARVVDGARQAALKPIHGGDDRDGLRKYVAVIEQGPDSPAPVAWHSFDAYDVQATLEPGQRLLLLETYDQAWEARVDGNVLATHPDVLGFTTVDAPPGRHTVRMRFVTPMENRAGYVALALSGLVFVALILI